MTAGIRERLYAWGRDILPVGARRAIRRGLPVERLFGIRKFPFEARDLARARRDEIAGRPDVILLAAAVTASHQTRFEELASGIARAGGRVFTDLSVAKAGEPGLLAIASSHEAARAELDRRDAIHRVLLADGSDPAACEELAGRLGARVETLPPDYAGDGAALLTALRSAFPMVSVIVVTFNNLDDNRACLMSLQERSAWPNVELIFVDNASTDGTAEWLAAEGREQPGIRTVFNRENRGFAAAVNQGLTLSRGPYLCLLNNDTIVTPSWLSALVAHLERDSGIGMVGATTNEISNEARVSVGYRNPEELFAWARAFTRRHAGEAFPISMLAMFCVLFRRSLLDTVGALDERFSVGMFEDDDYCRRVRASGFDLVCARDAFVHHRGRASFARLGQKRYLAIFEQNRHRYQEKWRTSEMPEEIRAADRPIVFLPSIPWNTPLVQRPHHLARALARAGRTVIFDCGEHVEDRFLGWQRVEPRLYLFQGSADQLRSLRAPLLWTFAYNVPDLASWPGAELIYDAIDDLEMFPFRRGRLERDERRALRSAAAVFAVSTALVSRISPFRPDVKLLPNGVWSEAFRAVLEPRRSNGRPVVGYMGSLARRLDYDLLGHVAAGHPEIDFAFVGARLDDTFDRSGLARLPNVRDEGPRSHSEIPLVLADFDVAIIPFRMTKEAIAASPIKLYEYFAAGKPVVATPLPEVLRFPEVRCAATASEWSKAIGAALDDSRNPSVTNRLRKLAAAHDWLRRAEEVERVLAQTTGPGAL